MAKKIHRNALLRDWGKPGEVINLRAQPRIGRIKISWDIHPDDLSKIDHFELFAKYQNDSHFWRIDGFSKTIRAVEIPADPLASITFRIQIAMSNGTISEGKTIETSALHPKVVSDEFDGRKLLVYLPEGYHQETRHYPVVYMHDGQNLFSERLAFVEDWRVDRVLDRIISEGKLEKTIVVGIYNSSRRAEEYTPFADKSFGGGEAREFSSFIVKRIIPYIEGKYRASPKKEDRAVMGSSFGGILSLWMGYTYPDVFSLVGAISPSLWIADGQMLIELDNQPKKDIKIWIDQGTGEWSDFTRNAVDILKEKGYQYGSELIYYEVKGATHNELFWADRVECPFIMFKGKPPNKIIDIRLDIQAIKRYSVGPFRYIINPVGFFDNGIWYSLYSSAEYSIAEYIEKTNLKDIDGNIVYKDSKSFDEVLPSEIVEEEIVPQLKPGPEIDNTGVFRFNRAKSVKITVKYMSMEKSIIVENPHYEPPVKDKKDSSRTLIDKTPLKSNKTT